MKAIFFPSYMGGGFGHVARCLALANAWQTAGHEAEFALNGPHLGKVEQAGFRTYRMAMLLRPETNRAAYILVSGLAYQWLRDGYHSPKMVQRAVQEGIKICQASQPDVIVSDYWPIARIVAQACRLPLVQIVENFSHPQGTPLVWWEALPQGIIAPNIIPVVASSLKRYHIPQISRAEDMNQGDLLLIPSIPALDPLPAVPENTHYVGALLPSMPGNSEVEPDPLIYVSVGGAASLAGGMDFFRMVVQTFDGAAFHGVLSTGGEVNLAELGHISSNLRIENWVSASEMLDRCALAVFHGGTATRMEVLMRGKPAIVIPFHSEQENSGRRLQAAGAGLTLPYSVSTWEMNSLHWAGGPFTLAFRRQPTLVPAALRQTIETVLYNSSYRQNAQRLQQEMVKAGGVERAIELIEKAAASFAPPPIPKRNWFYWFK
jgi:MGT family glycosyltransferase